MEAAEFGRIWWFGALRGMIWYSAVQYLTVLWICISKNRAYTVDCTVFFFFCRCTKGLKLGVGIDLDVALRDLWSQLVICSTTTGDFEIPTSSETVEYSCLFWCRLSLPISSDCRKGEVVLGWGSTRVSRLASWSSVITDYSSPLSHVTRFHNFRLHFFSSRNCYTSPIQVV